MNTKNNKRRLLSQEKIETTFFQLLQTRELAQISVSEICKQCGLNRSTFYANYADVYELADKIRVRLEQEVNALYENDIANQMGNDYLRLFRHIKDNQLFYQTYFKLGYDHTSPIHLEYIKPDYRLFPQEHMDYHIEFHKAGLNAMIKKWLKSGCIETPETMAEMIAQEYRGRDC